MIAATIIAACWINGSVAEEQGGGDQRQQAQALVASGKPAEALPIYDELTAAGSSNPSLYSEATPAATAAHDMPRAAIYFERHVKAEPDNFILRSLVPYVWRLAGDEAKAKQAATDYIAYWKASRFCVAILISGSIIFPQATPASRYCNAWKSAADWGSATSSIFSRPPTPHSPPAAHRRCSA
jgi:hypothetical protein